MRTCQLDGCENSLEGMDGNNKYCCSRHRKTPRDDTPERRAKAKAYYKRQIFSVCQFDGCETSLKGRHGKSKYCGKHSKLPQQRTEGKEYFRAHAKTYYEKNKDIILAKHKAYRQSPEGKATIKIAKKAYRVKAYNQTPERKAKEKIRVQKRIAQKNALPATFTIEDWWYCLKYFDHKCAYCQEPFRDTTPHQEHFIPLSLDGSYTPDNIICACPSCNLSKCSNLPEDWCTPEQYERVVSYLVLQ